MNNKMRVVTQIENPYFQATIHQYNDKYLVNLVGGPMEQVYKFPKDAIDSIEQLKLLVVEKLIPQAVEIHKQMMNNYKSGVQFLNQSS